VRLRLREKIQQHLEHVDKQLHEVQEADSRIPAHALEKIDTELRSLREQLEQLRVERDAQAATKETPEQPQLPGAPSSR
jgi:uncharacterized protein YicC (UPF0701 family)